MSFTVSQTENAPRAPILPASSYIARLYMLVDLGTHPAEYKNDKTGKMETKRRRKVRLGFEILSETADFGKGHPEPYTIGRDYSRSFGSADKPSALLQDIQAWRGKPFTVDELRAFDLTKLVGIPALIGVTHQKAKAGHDYAKLHSIGKPPKEMQCAPPVLAPLVYSIEQGTGGCFSNLPKFVQENIMQSDEWKAAISGATAAAPASAAAATTEAAADDCPF